MGFRLVPISIALNDRNARLYPTQLLSELAAEKGIDPYYRGQRRELRVCSVYLHVCTHVQCIFAGRLTPNLDFEVTILLFFNVKFLENNVQDNNIILIIIIIIILYLQWPSDRKSCMIHRIVPFSMTLFVE